MPADGIYMDHAPIGLAVEELQANGNEIAQIIDDLKAALNRHVNEWSGADRHAYNTIFIPAWSTELEILQGTIIQRAKTLGGISEMYRMVDASNAMNITGVRV